MHINITSILILIDFYTKLSIITLNLFETEEVE